MTFLRSRKKGQAVVELAFIVLIMTVMLAGTLELGRAFSAWLQVGNMARAGAQYGSIAAVLGDENLDEVEDAALDEIRSPDGSATIYGSAPSVLPDVLSDDYGFCAVEVTVTYVFEPLMPIGPIPSEIELSRSTQMRLQFVSAEMDDPPLNGEGDKCR